MGHLSQIESILEANQSAEEFKGSEFQMFLRPCQEVRNPRRKAFAVYEIPTAKQVLPNKESKDIHEMQIE
jgi:hypothetical protein